MTVKEILSEITDYISLSPIANNHYGKSRQWLYHKINEDVINNVQYKLSDAEIDILISAFDNIQNNVSSVKRNLEEFKTKREYLSIPQKERNLLEKYQEQIRKLSIANEYDELMELLREIYKSETSSYILAFADSFVGFNSWELLNLKGEPIKYEGTYVRTIVDGVISTIEKKVEAELKKRKRKKKVEEDEEDYVNDNSDFMNYSSFRSDIDTLIYKLYYKLNKIAPTELIQKMINKMPETITYLGNIEVNEIEKLVYEKMGINME